MHACMHTHTHTHTHTHQIALLAQQPNVVFDQSSKMILYASLAGIKLVNLVENKVLSHTLSLSLTHTHSCIKLVNIVLGTR